MILSSILTCPNCGHRSREVVSRQLAEFQRAGRLALARGKIRLVDRAGLADLAGVI